MSTDFLSNEVPPAPAPEPPPLVRIPPPEPEPEPDPEIFYSASARGFYVTGLNDDIPSDAVLITFAEHQSLMAGQAAGQEIAPDANGFPVLVDRIPPEDPEGAPARVLNIDSLTPEDIAHLRAALGLS